MIELESAIQGKTAYFGEARHLAKQFGLSLCGSWEYDGAFLDATLHREGGETIYLRMPFHVLEGELDRNDAFIEFGKPFVIKHIVHIGLDKDEASLFAATGLNQFQEPLDKDGQIRNKTKWEEIGEDVSNQFASAIADLRGRSIS
ncbi:YugN family protein [Ornithinibacillus californiensis]|uniref:YugN family protein n=1 Tax=Ornithinibacillus californiensis TaxID=161536 RepID=UPI00064D81A7|nr:YugN family protein [Ornithinibacillus californiensis]